MDNQETYRITAPSGRVWTLRHLPKHFFLYYGQLPTVMTAEVLETIKSGDRQAVEDEIAKTLAPEELVKTATFIRDAIDYAVVHPKISLNPKDDSEISPFQITPEDFELLSVLVMKGGEAGGLETFRIKSQ